MPLRLFHISEQPGIELFEPRPSPSVFEQIEDDVVFAISDRLLHNYLLPRECPRVTYYASANTSAADKAKFWGSSNAHYIITVERAWYQRVADTTLYCYEFPTDNFTIIDECAGYYVSYLSVEPIAERVISNPITEILKGNVELRFTPNLKELAAAVANSTLNFSLIRMRNAL
ncbi:hypothetical protein SAMN05216464_101777 [Mucilaginibacter pineti]|uniref:Uncharacterized protein n=1 Tax=Mucilaginibacter pineti TaxID=1391627 RepID=A0A1G6UW44_9SPHI|nr:DUF6886 family protein [Mucilaginibacter pineti]SDD45491.1 hypothetical protein SAMN05216464_101777 [Mucilaginibacter pineti]